jgi:hypothetical protein
MVIGIDGIAWRARIGDESIAIGFFVIFLDSIHVFLFFDDLALACNRPTCRDVRLAGVDWLAGNG